MSAKKVRSILRAYALKNHDARIEYRAFLQFLDAYTEKWNDPFLKRLTSNPFRELVPLLVELKNHDFCKLEYKDDSIEVIEFHCFYTDIVQKEYKRIDEKPDTPFPTLESLPVKIPSEYLHPINVKTDFVEALNQTDAIEKELILIRFPGEINDIVVLKNMIRTKLVDYSIGRIGLYLQKGNNAGYIRNKLLPVFKGSDQMLNDSISDITTKPNKASEMIRTPTAFSFQFWTHMASTILQDLKEKREKLVDEQGFCQGAYLIGFYIVYQKGTVQREKEKKTDVSQIEKLLRDPPYAFTLEDIYQFTDKSGVTFAQKYSTKFIHEYLQEKTHEKGNKHIPVIVRFVGSDKKGYFISREKIVPLFLKELSAASDKLRGRYMEEWSQKIHDGAKDPAMKSLAVFQKELTKQVESEFTVLAGLLNRGLLFLAKEEADIPASVSEDIERCFTREHELRPIDELLGLDARALIRDAKARLPFWETVPFVRQMVGFFKGLFTTRAKPTKEPITQSASRSVSFMEVGANKRGGGSGGRAKSGGSSKKSAAADKARMKKAVEALKKEFLPGDKPIARTLSQLADRWNPLLDPKAKANLVEDVNSLIRDFLRKLRRSFQLSPPDAARVRTMASDLSRSKNLAAIKRKDDLLQYIELYIIKLLDSG